MATPTENAKEEDSSSNLGIVAVAIKLLSKVGKLFKGFKGLLFIGSGAAYAAVYGPIIGIGLLLLLLVHEMGHVWAAKTQGVEVNGVYFIPFLGAVAMLDPENFRDRRTEFIGTWGGPALGMVPVLIMSLVYGIKWQHDILLSLIVIGSFLNTFNLLPMLPLDGGRMLRSMAASTTDRNFVAFFFVVLCMVGGLGWAAWQGWWGLFVIGILGFSEMMSDYKAAEDGDTTPMSKYELEWAIFAFVILAAVCIGMFVWSTGAMGSEALRQALAS